MSTTATAAPSATTAPVEPTAAQHAEAISGIATQCMEVKFTVRWFPTSLQASQASRDAMVHAVEGKKKGFSISKRLLSADHPMIKDLNSARRAVFDCRDAFTILKAGGASSSDGEVDREIKLEAGVRLIRTKDIEEFETRMSHCRTTLRSAAAIADAHLREACTRDGKHVPSIIDMDKEKLGKDFNANDYPDSLSKLIEVTDLAYQAYSPSTLLPPEIYRRESSRLRREIDNTIEASTRQISDDLGEMFLGFLNSLSEREFAHPDEAGKYKDYEGCEIVRKYRRPDGRMRVRLDRAGARSEIEFDTFEEYRSLLNPRPNAKSASKRIVTSSIDAIMEKLEAFSRTKSILGVHGDNLDKAMSEVRRLFKKAGSSGEDVAKEVKKSTTFKRDMSLALEEAAWRMDDCVDLVKVSRRNLILDDVVIDP